MITKKVTYIDLDGNEQTEKLQFHVSEAEFVEKITELNSELMTDYESTLDNAKDKKAFNKLSKSDDPKDKEKLVRLLKKTIDERYEEDLNPVKQYKELILSAYGKRDGNRFIKSKEISNEFSQTEAFSALVVELLSDEKSAMNFVRSIIPDKYKIEFDNMTGGTKKSVNSKSKTAEKA